MRLDAALIEPVNYQARCHSPCGFFDTHDRMKKKESFGRVQKSACTGQFLVSGDTG